MFDAVSEFNRAKANLERLLEANADKFDITDPITSLTMYGVYNYLLGVLDALNSGSEDRPLAYPEHIIEPLIAARKTDGVPFDLIEETERVNAYLAMFSEEAKFCYNYFETNPDTDEARTMGAIMTVGILSGIQSALMAVQGRYDLDYSALIPETPAGLDPNDL